MSFTIPKEIKFARDSEDVLVYKHPLTTGTRRDLIDHAIVYKSSEDITHSPEVLTIDNETPFTGLSILRVFNESEIQVQFPFHWGDGTPVTLLFSTDELSILSIYGDLCSQTFQFIDDRGTLKCIPTAAFATKEFKALHATSETKTLADLGPDDNGKIFMLQRNARKEYCVFMQKAGTPTWLGYVQSLAEWGSSHLEDTGLKLSPEATQGYWAYIAAASINSKERSNLRVVAPEHIQDTLCILTTFNLSTILKTGVELELFITQPCKEDAAQYNVSFEHEIKETNHFKISPEMKNELDRAFRITAEEGSNRVGYAFILTFGKYRTSITARMAIGMPWGTVHSFEVLKGKTLEELLEAIHEFMTLNGLGYVVIDRQGVPCPAYHRYGLWS